MKTKKYEIRFNPTTMTYIVNKKNKYGIYTKVYESKNEKDAKIYIEMGGF